MEPGAIWSPKALHCLARSHGVLNHIETLGNNARNKREKNQRKAACLEGDVTVKNIVLNFTLFNLCLQFLSFKKPDFSSGRLHRVNL